MNKSLIYLLLIFLVVTQANAAQIVMDDFTRDISSGWGVTSSGENWIVGPDPSPFSVIRNRGQIEVVPGAFSRKAMIAINSLHTEIMGKISWDSTMSNGYAFGGLALRVNEDRNNYYYASVRDNNSYIDIVLYRVIGNSGSVIAKVNTPLVYDPNTQYYLRFIATGESPTTLRVKVWPSLTQAEPSSWNMIEIDSQPEMQISGAAGVRAGISRGAINPTAVFFDDVSVSSLTEDEVVNVSDVIQSAIDSGLLTGPEGPAGVAGPQGERGETGPPGPSLTLSCTSIVNRNSREAVCPSDYRIILGICGNIPVIGYQNFSGADRSFPDIDESGNRVDCKRTYTTVRARCCRNL